MRYLNKRTGLIWDVTDIMILDRIKNDGNYEEVTETETEAPEKTAKKKGRKSNGHND